MDLHGLPSSLHINNRGLAIFYSSHIVIYIRIFLNLTFLFLSVTRHNLMRKTVASFWMEIILNPIAIPCFTNHALPTQKAKLVFEKI